MSSSSADPKPVVTGYPAHASYPYPAPPPPSYYSNGAPPPPSYYSNGAPPPPPPPPHGNFYPAPYAAAPQRRYSATSLRRLLSILIAVFIILGAVILIIWLVLRPRLPEVAVSSVSLSGFNLSTSQQLLSADFDLNFTVHNPNGKMSIYYDRVAAAVLYDSDTLSDTSLAPFYQVKGETTPLRARLVAASEYVDSDVVRGINSDRSREDGTVVFHFRILAWVRFRTGAWRTRWHVLRVYCNDVPIGFRNETAAATGYLVGPAPKKCVANI